MQEIIFTLEIIIMIFPIAIVIYLSYVVIGETKVKCKQCGMPTKRKNITKGKCTYCKAGITMKVKSSKLRVKN